MTISRKSLGLAVFLILLLGLLAACAAPAATRGGRRWKRRKMKEEMAAEPTEPWYDEADVDSRPYSCLHRLTAQVRR